MPSVVMPSIVMLSDVLLSFVMLIVIMLNVVAPFFSSKQFKFKILSMKSDKSADSFCHEMSGWFPERELQLLFC
jgi:hypothetical protein